MNLKFERIGSLSSADDLTIGKDGCLSPVDDFEDVD
jgi:hypothetical protein